MRWRWQVYQRPFRDPHITAHGVWAVREGILLSSDQGAAEIAPIPWMGSESLQEALDWCQSAPPDLDTAWLAQIPDHLPATQFGFSCLLNPLPAVGDPPDSALLLGTVTQALTKSLNQASTHALTWDPPGQHPLTVKIKIALLPLAQEQAALEELLQMLPRGSRLRLDANGGLSAAESWDWLAWCQDHPVEYLEQPLGDPDLLWTLAAATTTPLAVDESLGRDLGIWRDWPGILVMKPSLWGSPQRLLEACQALRPDGVISSALETAVGYGHVIRVGQHLRPWLRHDRLWGLGVTPVDFLAGRP